MRGSSASVTRNDAALAKAAIERRKIVEFKDGARRVRNRAGWAKAGGYTGRAGGVPTSCAFSCALRSDARGGAGRRVERVQPRDQRGMPGMLRRGQEVAQDAAILEALREMEAQHRLVDLAP